MKTILQRPAKSGTEWVAPGEGATRKQLLAALSAQAGEERTRLALTDRPLNSYDVQRIKEVLQ